MMSKFNEIFEAYLDYMKNTKQNAIDNNVLLFFHFLIKNKGFKISGLSYVAQKEFLLSCIVNNYESDISKEISKEYIYFLNEKALNMFLEGDSQCDMNDIICLSKHLSDKSIELLQSAVNSDVRDKAFHILSLSEDTRCIKILNVNAPNGFILIPAGEFVFGSNNSPDERCEKKIWLPSFYISKYPITDLVFRTDDITQIGDGHSFPCHSVSWFDAFLFAKKHGFHLPSEAQWEKAARGKNGFEYPWGNEFNSSFINSFESNSNTFSFVDSFERQGASPYGVVDCCGNCWEWTGSLYEKYDKNYFLNSVDENVDGDRVLRGGAYDFDRYGVTCTNRYRCNPSNSWDTHGFRVAINL